MVADLVVVEVTVVAFKVVELIAVEVKFVTPVISPDTSMLFDF